MTIATLDSIRQRIAADAAIKNATALQHFKLWYAFVRSDPMNMLFPYGEPAIEFARKMNMQMQNLGIESMQNNPVVCANCGASVGVLDSGKASVVYATLHAGCSTAGKIKPLSYLYNMQHVARELGVDYNAFEHNLILLEIEYAEWRSKRDEAQGSSDGFEFISSLDCGSTEQQICSHDNAGRDELSAAGGSNQLPLL